MPHLRTDVILSCSGAAVYYLVVGSCACFSALFCAGVLTAVKFYWQIKIRIYLQ